MWLGMLSAVALGGPCDPGEVANVASALETVEARHRVDLASVGVSQACAGAPALAGAAASITQSPPDYRPLLDLKLVTDDPAPWLAVCSGGLAPLQRMAQVVPKDKRPAVWKGCGLGRHDWFSESEWAGADGLVVIPLYAGKALEDSGIDEASTRRIVRALAGIGGGAGKGAGGAGRLPAPPEPEVELPSLTPPDSFDPVEGRPPPVEAESKLLPRFIGVVGDSQDSVFDVITDEELAAVDQAVVEGSVGVFDPSAERVRPGFVERPKVRWSGKARKADQRVCKVEVTVRKAGVYGKVTWVDCPEALRKDVLKALERADYTAGSEAGEPTRMTFKTRFTVR